MPWWKSSEVAMCFGMCFSVLGVVAIVVGGLVSTQFAPADPPEPCRDSRHQSGYAGQECTPGATGTIEGEYLVCRCPAAVTGTEAR